MTGLEKEFIAILDDYEIDIFTGVSLKDGYGIVLSDWETPLRSLIKSGYLQIIEKGKYCRHNFKDAQVIGSFLVPEGAVAYWSALNLHGLTEQFPNTVFMQTARLKQDKAVFGVPYKFIKVKAQKLIGIENAGYGNHTYRITDREKTIVDCFDLPEYGGELPGIIRAFATQEWDEAKLMEYADAVGNHAAIKRMGYCAELFGLRLPKFIALAKTKVTKTVSLFDNNSPVEGAIDTRWGLRFNVTREDIESMKYY